MRFLGFMFHLWSQVVFVKIRDERGEFVLLDKHRAPITNLHRDMIFIHPSRSFLLSLLRAEVRNFSFTLQPQ